MIAIAENENNPMVLEAYAEMQRCYANPETHDKARQHRNFIVDYYVGMHASKKEGFAEGKARVIVLTLSRRFNDVSQEIRDKLLGLRDIDQIDGLANFAFDCQSLEEFASHLR